jgi:hypothetical protein
MKTLLLLAAVVAIVGHAPKNHANLERPASEADLLRAFGFSACLAKAYDKTPFGTDAERVADGYRQMGKLALEPYDQVRKAAESIDAAKPTIEGHHNFAIMSCLEWYENAKTKQLVRKIADKPRNQ